MLKWRESSSFIQEVLGFSWGRLGAKEVVGPPGAALQERHMDGRGSSGSREQDHHVGAGGGDGQEVGTSVEAGRLGVEAAIGSASDNPTGKIDPPSDRGRMTEAADLGFLLWLERSIWKCLERFARASPRVFWEERNNGYQATNLRYSMG